MSCAIDENCLLNCLMSCSIDGKCLLVTFIILKATYEMGILSFLDFPLEKVVFFGLTSIFIGLILFMIIFFSLSACFYRTRFYIQHIGILVRIIQIGFFLRIFHQIPENKRDFPIILWAILDIIELIILFTLSLYAICFKEKERSNDYIIIY